MNNIIAVAGILWRDKKFLAACRPEGKIMAGYWEFPGGKIEAGEKPAQALERELQEELGVQIEEYRFWQQVSHQYEHGLVVLSLFHVFSFNGEPRPLEQQELRWLEPEEALKLQFLPVDFPLLRQLIPMPTT